MNKQDQTTGLFETTASEDHQHHVLHVLCSHIGRNNGISAKALAQKVGLNERQCRAAVEALRESGAAVCAMPQTGYFIAETDADVTETCDFLKGRAMTSLKQVSRLTKIALPDLVGQLHFKT